jgi:hypothetical protein
VVYPTLVGRVQPAEKLINAVMAGDSVKRVFALDVAAIHV